MWFPLLTERGENISFLHIILVLNRRLDWKKKNSTIKPNAFLIAWIVSYFQELGLFDPVDN